jgi:molybdenum cofactor guanylyltransferase
MSAHRDVAGFVLVGGRSSRMGADKATLNFRGTALACRIARQMEPVVDTVSLVGDPLRYGHLGLPVIGDERPGEGPVGAIISALHASRATYNIVAACDLPAVQTPFFAALLDRIRATEAQCVIPITPDGREQVLCAAYHRDAAADLDRGEARLRTAVSRLRVDYWRVDSSDWALNLNTPQDWAMFREQEAS